MGNVIRARAFRKNGTPFFDTQECLFLRTDALFCMTGKMRDAQSYKLLDITRENMRRTTV